MYAYALSCDKVNSKCNFKSVFQTGITKRSFENGLRGIFGDTQTSYLLYDPHEVTMVSVDSPSRSVLL